tara:strand:- start:279 stop:494 length:216 start_codon:yes stop_codon:yes gene_type:complete
MDAYMFGVWAGALTVGTLCGIIPYRLGKKYSLESWGIAGLIACILGGLIGGMIIGIPIAGIFSAIILSSKD